MPDWLDGEIVIVVAMAAAGIWAMISEARAHRRDADERIGLHSRMAALEVAIAAQAPHTIAERVAEIEGRVSALPEADVAALRERVAAIEARIDHRPITHTRGAKGRFASPAEVSATCEDQR